jgi:hypothetical protein
MRSNPDRRPITLIAVLLIVGALIAGLVARLRRRAPLRSRPPGVVADQSRVFMTDQEDRKALPSMREDTSESIDRSSVAARGGDAARRAIHEEVVSPDATGFVSEESKPSFPWAYALLFTAILLAGFYFRFVGMNWDESQHLHPDERFLTMVSTAVEIPDSLSAYFDSQSSPLNPYNKGYGLFVYGDLPITLTRLIAEALTAVCAPAPDAPIEAATGLPSPTPADSILRAIGLSQVCTYSNGSARPTMMSSWSAASCPRCSI